jgi:hypothetical protein
MFTRTHHWAWWSQSISWNPLSLFTYSITLSSLSILGLILCIIKGTVLVHIHKEMLDCLWEAFCLKHTKIWAFKVWILQHDNALAHWLEVVQQQLGKHGTVVLHQPTYSPSFVPCNFCLFPLMKGCHFNAPEVQAISKILLYRGLHAVASDIALYTTAHSGFQKCFWQLYTCWNKCIAAKGQYFEGDCVMASEYCYTHSFKSCHNQYYHHSKASALRWWWS